MMKKYELPDELMFLRNSKAEQKQSDASMKGKVVVITGATSGVGLEAVRRLAKGQATIVMVVRNQLKAEAVKKELQMAYPVAVDIILADFSRSDQVRHAATTILEKYERIDVLINCAGLHSTKVTYTPEGFETVFFVNHLASFLFTKLLLDRLIQSAPSRILHINSEGHRFNGLDIEDIHWKKRHYTGLRGYGASKTAQLLTMWEMADQLEGSGVTINAMHPGDVKTHIGSNNGWIYRTFSKLFIQPMLKDPKISGEAIYYLVADSQMADISGKFFHLTIEETPAKHALDRLLGKKVYDLSMKITGLDKYV
jgi:NAD(P)-dependent dehydrogenase (short-subunit alcohol dehydrogenase family)